MRKLMILFCVVAGLVACTNDDVLEKTVDKEEMDLVQYDPNRRSYAEALEIAQNSIRMLQDENSTARSAEPARTLDLKNGVKAVRQTVTRSNGTVSGNDTLLYIFNFEDGRGFSVVSASRRTNGLIAVTETGHYDPEVKTGNPGFDMYMEMAKAYVAYEDQTPLIEEVAAARAGDNYPRYKPIYDTVFYQKIEPRIKVKWGQKWRMGQYCPNGVSGCSNTAAAQIMSYFKYPTSLTLTYSGKEVNSTVLNWNTMCNGDHTYADSETNRDEADKQIGRLARQLGQAAESEYHSFANTNNNWTGTADSKIRSAIQSLGYNVGSITNYNYLINNNPNLIDYDAGYPLATLLANNKLIYMSGECDSSNVGHVWVIDGCYYVKAKYLLMFSNDGINWTVDQELGIYRTCHNHINWGLNGAQDGYFNHYVFNAYNFVQRDDYKYYMSPGKDLNYYKNIAYFTVWR